MGGTPSYTRSLKKIIFSNRTPFVADQCDTDYKSFRMKWVLHGGHSCYPGIHVTPSLTSGGYFFSSARRVGTAHKLRWLVGVQPVVDEILFAASKHQSLDVRHVFSSNRLLFILPHSHVARFPSRVATTRVKRSWVVAWIEF